MSRLVFALVLVATAGCPGAGTPSPMKRVENGMWEAALDRRHPLVGRGWDVRRGTFISLDALFERLAAAQFVLLGEKHDNADHHRLQARALLSIVNAGRRPTVAFEMLGVDDQPALDRYLATRSASAAGLGAAVGWEQSGWPPWTLYAPIAEVALRAGLPMVAANLPEAQAHALMRHGHTGLDPTAIQRLGLDVPLPGAMQAALDDELRQSHCGQMPPAMIAPIGLVQRARDAQMAETLLTVGAARGAVLIAGAGHVRADRGVPRIIRAARPSATLVAVAFVEVVADASEPQAYARRFGLELLPFDYVFFTPRTSDEDPCASLKPRRADAGD